jgi:hypothetical protein
MIDLKTKASLMSLQHIQGTPKLLAKTTFQKTDIHGMTIQKNTSIDSRRSKNNDPKREIHIIPEYKAVSAPRASNHI